MEATSQANPAPPTLSGLQDGSPCSPVALPILLLGLPMTTPTSQVVLDCLDAPASSRHQKAHYLANVGARSLLEAQEDPTLKQLLTDADFRFPTGLAARLASRFMGLSFSRADSHWKISRHLLDKAEARGASVFILGEKGSPTVTLRNRLKKRRPKLKLQGEFWTSSADWSTKTALELNKLLRESPPDILLVSLQHRPARIWLAENARSLARFLVWDFGDSDGLLAQIVAMRRERRSNAWATRLLTSLRSLYRCNQETLSRASRFSLEVLRHHRAFRRCQGKRPRDERDADFVLRPEDGYHQITLPKRFDATFLNRFGTVWNQVTKTSSGLLVDATQLCYFDPTSLACLIQLTKQLQRRSHYVVIQNPPLSLVRFLQETHIPKSLTSRYSASAAVDLARTSIWEHASANEFNSQIIVWKGNVTAQTVDRIWTETTAKIKQYEQATQSFRIELSRVTLLDSTGIGTMIKLKKRLENQGYRIAFVNPRPNVLKILDMTQLTAYLLRI